MGTKKKAVILDLATFKPDELVLDSLLSLPLDWRCYDLTSPEDVAKRIDDCHIVMSNKVVLDRQLILQARHLEYVGVLATGTNNIDHQAARERNIVINNVKGYGTASVVQHTFMLMLNLAAQFLPYQKQVRQGGWQTSKTFCLLDHPIVELAGKNLLIVGYGELGKAVEKVAQAFAMNVTVAARPGSVVSDGRVSFDEALPKADFVSLHCLLSDSTKGLVNAERLALMKPTAFLINTARGPLVDEHALLQALLRQQIAGAAIDVMDTEPPDPDNVLLQADLSNLIVTPHNAWASIESRQRLLDMAADKLGAYLLA